MKNTIVLIACLLSLGLLASCENNNSAEYNGLNSSGTITEINSILETTTTEITEELQPKVPTDWQITYAEYLDNLNYDDVFGIYVGDINQDNIPEIVISYGDFIKMDVRMLYYDTNVVKEIEESFSWRGGFGGSYEIRRCESSGQLIFFNSGYRKWYYSVYDDNNGDYEKYIDLLYWYDLDYQYDDYGNILDFKIPWNYSVNGIESDEVFFEDDWEVCRQQLVESIKNSTDVDLDTIKNVVTIFEEGDSTRSMLVLSLDVDGDFTAYFEEKLFY
ncbi:MAG: hypothetical protein FWG90_05045 [Oscillospiraceae bacterium]|nr:hypothetical protein [Oscillospiraceae bacterium]